MHFFNTQINMMYKLYFIQKSDTISVLNDENNRLIDFNIVTSVVNTIQMFKIQEYLKNGSSNLPPGEAFQALDIVLKNRPFSLRLVNSMMNTYRMHKCTKIRVIIL